MFLEYSQTLLRNYWNLPKDQHLLLSNHTLLTQKQLFHRELLKKSFPLKCSLNAPWMSRTLQHWGNTQRIFPEYCVPAGIKRRDSQLNCFLVNFSKFLKTTCFLKEHLQVPVSQLKCQNNILVETVNEFVTAKSYVG